VKSLSGLYLAALGIPLVLIFSGGIAKKLVRGSGWQQSDFFLGVELALAAMASALVYALDLARQAVGGSDQAYSAAQKMIVTAFFTAVCFFILLWMLSLHQDWERRSHNPRGQLLWLGLIGNTLGIALIVAFILFVKGV
jgi:uncharacterized PurR-regulated membrane protein YhhQ (DUF165 family)